MSQNISKEKGFDSKESSDTASVVNSNLEKQYSNRYQFADFDKMYNPYKVFIIYRRDMLILLR